VKEFFVFFVRTVHHAGMCISKAQKLISAKEKSKQNNKRKQNKKNMYIIYKELSSSKVFVQGLAIDRVGVRLPL
jgi:hypothetical protein